MLKDNIKKINKAISGDRMLDRIREISCYHRIQASEGYRAAAIHCSNALREDGIKSEILSYPAGNEQRYLTMGVFQEWRCKQAYCNLILPNKEIIADYSEDNLSIIQKSYAWDHPSTPIDIVLLDRGCDKSAYEGLDIAGKIIFVRDSFYSYLDWAIEKGGAIGIITDHIAEVQGGRTRYDLIDIKKYNTFWWTKDNNSITPFGFVLTPRAGDKLAETCLKMRLENDKDSTKPLYPQANCFVDSEFYDGSFENVSATLPGESSEEILITAHLCHPRSSANDNASGVTAAMEVLKVLGNLIEKGELPPLKRTIRILLIPEYTGLYAYLDSIGVDRSKIKAGINLDMVGGKQEKGYGPLTLSGLPRSTPSFVMDLAVLIFDELKKEVPGFSPGSLVPMFNSATVEFTGGSDNFILSDPTIGIPTPMLGQWPDMYYHTSGDTPEVISTHILSKSATLAAAYAFTLANLSEKDLPSIFGKAYVRMQEELTELQNRALRGELTLSKLADEFAHYTDYYVKACEDYKRFFSGEELISVNSMIVLETDRLSRSADDMLSHFCTIVGDRPLNKNTFIEDKYMYIPHRKYVSPVNQLAEYTEASEELKEVLKQYSKNYRIHFSDSYYAELLVQYYIDGKRTAAEISKNVIMDCRNGDMEAVHQYIQLLIKLDLVELIK
ncbi:MAG: hypothetical protein K0R09_3661 [Clostridiales bacterium]|nr:hypothetical protein [Clostridiales bacterium]